MRTGEMFPSAELNIDCSRYITAWLPPLGWESQVLHDSWGSGSQQNISIFLLFRLHSPVHTTHEAVIDLHRFNLLNYTNFLKHSDNLSFSPWRVSCLFLRGLSVLRVVLPGLCPGELPSSWHSPPHSRHEHPHWARPPGRRRARVTQSDITDRQTGKYQN